MESRKEIRVNILRYDPTADTEPHYQTYSVPFEKGLSVSNVVQYIWENIDPSLAFYLSCRAGRCQGCMVEVNGQVKMACTTMAEGDLTLNPWPKYEIIKDLVVDLGHPRKNPSE